MDPPVQRRPIDFTGWELVFTQHGRYFFYDTVDKCSKWRAPEHLLGYLADLPEARRALLFDPTSSFEPETVPAPQEWEEPTSEYEEDYVVEEAPLGGGGGEGELVAEETSCAPEPSARPHWTSREEHASAIGGFRELLLQTPEVDPFMAWSTLSTRLAADARWQAIPTDRERKALFDELCPQLAERARHQRRQRMEEAAAAWNETLAQLTLASAPPTWVEFSRTVRGQPWFRLMDGKQMEKEYRARLAHLRTRSIVYQIPK